MKNTLITLFIACIAITSMAQQRQYAPVPKDVPTVEKINSKIGKLSFPLGYPTDKTAQMLEDEMLYINADNTAANSGLSYAGYFDMTNNNDDAYGLYSLAFCDATDGSITCICSSGLCG